MLTITRIFRFEACHSLPHYDGKCHQLHGHSYKLSVTVSGDIVTDPHNPKYGMIIDFSDLKKIVNEKVIDKYDHAHLNAFFENPTAEIMVEKIAEDISRALPNNVKLVSVKLWETENSYAEYIV